MSLVLTMYYGQLIIGLVCGAGVALCIKSLFGNKKFNYEKQCTK